MYYVTQFCIIACSVNINNRDANDIEVTLSKLRQFGSLNTFIVYIC